MTAPRLLGVLHPVIVTRDLPGALAFYRDLLGFRVAGEMVHDGAALVRLGGPDGAEASAVILEAADGTEIEIATFVRPEGRARTDAGWPDAGIRSITFVVDGLDAMAARLAAAGCRLAGEVVPFTVDGARVRVAYVNSPDGVVLTLLEREGGHDRP